MPIHIEQFAEPGQLNEQDRSDLLKIYQEAPTWMYQEEDAAAFLAARLQQWPGRLFAARFNDRLLGSCWLISDEQGLRIKWLTVRKTTRRRGVAKHLLEPMLELAQQEQQAVLLACRQNTATDFLMQACGFAKLGPEADRVLWRLDPS